MKEDQHKDKMKFNKQLSLIFISVLLLTSISAATFLTTSWEDQTLARTIEFGESAEFDIYASCVNPPLTISAKLYDSQGTAIHTFYDQTIQDSVGVGFILINPTYQVTQSEYQTSGDFEIRFEYSDADPNGVYETQILYLTVNPGPDTEAPVITLLGNPTETVSFGTIYTDAGATAQDDTDGDITSSIVTSNPVNTNVAGTYTITYNVQDTAGNLATQVTRTVIVNPATPNNPPTITSTPVTQVDENTAYSYQVIATDADNDTLTYAFDDAPTWLSIDFATGLIAGIAPSVTSDTEYNIEIAVEDEEGDEAHQIFTLTVNNIPDTTPPTITLLGNSPVTVELGSTYTDAGATASDNVDGNITTSIVIVNPVDTNTIGTYTITYNVQDAAGNNAIQVTRTVNVVDTTNPTIEIQGPIDGTTYNAPVEYLNFIATDTNLDSCSYIFNGASSVPVNCNSEDLTTVNINSIEGLNNLIVTAIDGSGNSASETITFTVDTTVPDTTAPTITVISPEAIEYNTSTITFKVVLDEDTEVVEMSLNGEISIPMINTIDHVFTYTLTDIGDGTHNVVFYAEDISGNTASKSVTFTIDTTEDDDEDDDTTTPIGHLSLDDENSLDAQYLAQFEPKTIYLDDQDIPEQEVSWFQKIINAIKNFFKKLFRLK